MGGAAVVWDVSQLCTVLMVSATPTCVSVSVFFSRRIWTRERSTDYRRPLRGWDITYTWTSWNKATHIWNFAAGLPEPSDADLHSCPGVSGTATPSYAGNDYFCESGNPGTISTGVLYGSDPLWDGEGYGSSPCCKRSSPPGTTVPWFCRQLPQAAIDNIEVRICGDACTSNEDTPVELIELYIH